MHETRAHILIVARDSDKRCELVAVLRRCGVDTTVCSGLAEAFHYVVQPAAFHLIFCEEKLVDGDYRDVLHLARQSGSGIPLVVCSLVGEFPEYLQAMELGAFDLVSPPYRLLQVQHLIESARREIPKISSARAASTVVPLAS